MTLAAGALLIEELLIMLLTEELLLSLAEDEVIMLEIVALEALVTEETIDVDELGGVPDPEPGQWFAADDKVTSSTRSCSNGTLVAEELEQVIFISNTSPVVNPGGSVIERLCQPALCRPESRPTAKLSTTTSLIFALNVQNMNEPSSTWLKAYPSVYPLPASAMSSVCLMKGSTVRLPKNDKS